MLKKYKMEAVHMDELKRKLFNELEMYESKVCACTGELYEKDVNCIYRLSKTLYYLDCITSRDKHHHHIHYKGDDIPDFLDGDTHHHVDYKEEIHADIQSTQAKARI